jgi:hypothetical protein
VVQGGGHESWRQGGEQTEHGEQEQDGEDGVGDHHGISHGLGQGPRKERADPEAAQIGGGGDDLEPAGTGLRAAKGIQIPQQSGGGGSDHPDPESTDQAGHDKARQSGPHYEEHRRQHLDAQGRDRDPTTAGPVPDVPSRIGRCGFAREASNGKLEGRASISPHPTFPCPGGRRDRTAAAVETAAWPVRFQRAAPARPRTVLTDCLRISACPL